LTAYEAGVRNQFFDNTLQINVGGFYYDYRDKQETIGGLDGLGLLDNVTINAAKATSDGVDVDTVWKPTADDRFSAGVEYLHAAYDDFSYYVPTAYISGGCTPISTGPSPPGLTLLYPTISLISCAGKQMARSPMWSGNAGYDHAFDLGSDGLVDFAATMTFGSSRWLAASYNSNLHAPDYNEENLFLTYTPADASWSATAYVRNLTDAVVATGGYPSLIPDDSALNINPPRTYGVQLKYHF
jgi:iron complex outermembrane receptor protein